jgi:hypothetical protein
MYNRPLILLLIALTQVGCRIETSKGATSDEAIAIANQHFEKVLPQVPLSDLTIKVEDKGDYWRVEYYPPAGSTGDGPLPVDVGKQDMRVVRGLQ